MIYNYQTPVSNVHSFLGRRSLVSKIYTRIGAGRPQSVSIVGDIKTGKSSLLWYLADENTKKELLNNPEDYIYLRVSCREEKQLSLENFTGTLYRMTREYAPDSEVPDDNQFKYNYFKKMVESLHKQNKKIIIFFDDFNLVTQNQAFPLEFFSFLRSLANNYNLAYVTTSYEDLQKLCVSKDIEESPFFNIFTNMSLRGFENAEIDQLLGLTAQEDGNNLSTDKEYLVKLVGSSPYALQMACFHLFQLKTEHGDFNPEIQLQFERLLKDNLQPYHQQLWLSMDNNHHMILTKLATGSRIPAAQEYLLRDLSKKDYISVSNGKNAITSTLLKDFILQTTGSVAETSVTTKMFLHYFSRLKRFLLRNEN
jgi:serine/threonine-protein kinase